MGFICRLAVVVLAAAVFTSDCVHGKSTLRAAKRDADEEQQAYCAMKMMSCVLSLMSLTATSEEQLREDIVEKGLSEVCTPLTAFTDCFTETVQECDVPLGPEQLQQMSLMVRITNFVCKDNLIEINSDRQCLFGDAMEQAAESQCGEVPDADQLAICQLALHINCTAGVYENICVKPQLANKFRALGSEIAGNGDCRRVVKVRRMFSELLELAKLK